ncbi:MAG: AraC family transcriptional regulator [Gammaproteobacteria bacterium]|nr:AraC family transcriptional regulator [Gammaproteobacteria bacterium]
MHDLEKRHPVLTEATIETRGSLTSFARAGSSDVTFQFDSPTVGFVLNPVDDHHAAYGSDKLLRVPLAPGVGWVIDGGIDGRCRWTGASAFLNVSLDPAVLQELSSGRDVSLPTLYGFQDPVILEMALAIHRAGDSETDGLVYRETMLRALAVHLLQVVDQHADSLERVLSPTDPRLARAVDYAEAHLHEVVSLEDMAAAARMSPFHFARSFKAATGETPHAYLIRRRIERATHLLRTTEASIEAVALQAGWQNKSHFIRAFKRRLGVTPGVYRQQKSA